MVKTVCFDLYNTLARYEPPLEIIHANACRDLGIEVNPGALIKALPVADMFWRNENSRSPIEKRPQDQKMTVYAEYEIKLLKEVEIEINHETALRIMAKIQQGGLNFEVYDDSLPTLKLLKDHDLTLGLISNVGQDVEQTCKELGLLPYLDFKVTSFEVGYDKPRPEIFLVALEKAQTKPEEAMYVGDQYDQDVVGARGVGMKALLLDRNDSFTDINDCPRIHSLAEIVDHI